MAYTVQPVLLDRGLDLVSPKLAAAPGSLLDCQNYEIVDLVGYKSIDGFVRYDGRVSPYAPTWFEITDASFTALSNSFIAGELIGTEGEDYPFGIVVDWNHTTKTISYLRINVDVEPKAGDTIVKFPDKTSTNFQPDTAPIDGQTTMADGSTAEDALILLNSYYETVKLEIGQLPNEAVGLHFHRDTLYAFCDEFVMGFTSGGSQVYPGDHIHNDLGFTGVVLDVSLVSGDWGDGDAAGDMLVYSTVDASPPTSGYVYINRPTSSIPKAFIATTTTTPAWRAGLWKGLTEKQAIDAGLTSSGTGWQRCNTGWLVDFENGTFSTGSLPKLDRIANNVTNAFAEFESPVTGTDGTFRSYAYGLALPDDPPASGGTTDIIVSGSNDTDTVNYLESDDGNRVLVRGWTLNKENIERYTRRLVLNNVKGVTGDVPADAVVTGIEVTVNYDQTVPAYTPDEPYSKLFIDFQLCNNGTTLEALGGKKIVEFSGDTETTDTGLTLTLGGPGDLWGLDSLSGEDIASSLFGLTIRGTATTADADPDAAGFAQFSVLMDHITVKYYYSVPFTRYYFWNGEDDVQADVIEYHKASGDFAAGTATGVLQVANVAPYEDADRRVILDEDEIYTSPGGTGNKIGDVVNGGMRINAPASFNQINEAGSRYQFVSANFYATDEWDQFFGVTGASRAFSYDGQYYVSIYTREDEEQDRPRHVAYHHAHLALGFRSGLVAMSVVGQPENFSGLLGAAEYPVGDKVVGLLPLNGTTLGVFCESSIWSLNGTITDNISTGEIAPNIGAIEYTVVDMGRPVFSNSNGIYTLDQTAAYGDFIGRPLSFSVSPWLRPRMRKTSNLLSVVNGTGVVCAIPVRTKNQYRLFFKDGHILTMTLNPEEPPKFTFQRYYVGQTSADDTTKFIVPLAWSSQMDDLGRERIHISHYSPVSEADAPFVYELDEGWSFDGYRIPLFFETNWFFGETPSQYMTLKKIRTEGLSRNFAEVKMYARGIQPDNTSDMEYAEEFGEHYEIIDLPRDPGPTVPAEFVPRTNLANIDARGLAFRLRVEGYGEQDEPQPPHVFQVFIIQADPEGADDQ